MKPVILALPGNTDMANALATRLDAEPGQVTTRHEQIGNSRKVKVIF